MKELQADMALEDLDKMTLIIPKDLVYEELDGEMVLLDLQSSQYFGIDEVGCRIWQLMGERHPPTEIAAILLEEYAVDEETCRRQLVEFLCDLVSNNLLKIEQ